MVWEAHFLTFKENINLLLEALQWKFETSFQLTVEPILEPMPKKIVPISLLVD